MEERVGWEWHNAVASSGVCPVRVSVSARKVCLRSTICMKQTEREIAWRTFVWVAVSLIQIPVFKK